MRAIRHWRIAYAACILAFTNTSRRHLSAPEVHMRMLHALPPAMLVLLAACHLTDGPFSPKNPPADAARSTELASPGYIITFNDSVSDPAALALQLAAEFGVVPTFVYTTVLKGFAAPLSAVTAQSLETNSLVRRVEADGIAEVTTTQTGATWGLDRIDQRFLPLSTTYTYNLTGAGVTVYIVDTGIRYDHEEFWTSTTDPTSRAVFGVDEIDAGGTGADCHGHGTHVSGTVGGLTYGVAKAVQLVAVRVLGCTGSGSWSGVIAGIDWMARDHAAGAPAVANASLGGGFNQSANDAVAGAVQDGIVFAVAAGNSNADAINYSPSSTPEAITVGATDQNDVRAYFSNWGSILDWFAPGVGITSAWYTSSTATNILSGTSMASPHTAGAAALYLEANPGSSPSAVRDGLFALLTKDIVTLANSTNAHLLYTLDIGQAPPPPPPPPPGFTLVATPTTHGAYKVALTWTGTLAATIDVWRDNVLIDTVANTGEYLDNLKRVEGTYVHQVCEAGTSICSNTVTTTFPYTILP
jgi:subtilisin family serine protease